MTRRLPDDSALIWILPVAAGIESLLLVRNLRFLDPPASIVMPVAQALIVLALLWLWRWLPRQESPGAALNSALHWVLIAIGLLLPLEQGLTGNGMLAANLALVLVVGGALISERKRFFLFCGALVAGWIIAVALGPPMSVGVGDQAIYVGLGCALGLAVFLIRDRDRAQLESARDEAFASAMRDHLTALWNRRGMLAIVPSMVGAARENTTGIWCLFIDVRGLKKVNDTEGHAAGDRLLTAVGSALQSTEVIGGVPARWGGDEFCVLGVGGPPDVRVAHRHLVDLVAQHYKGARHWDLSLGSAYESELDGDFLDSLVHAADEDMYRRRGSRPQHQAEIPGDGM